MSEAFDPYYKWLGIPPQNQPPDLYRLLSVERFEHDVEVIEAAASRQMLYVQSCATGPHLVHSQRLLNEISAARLCLLDPARKLAYDAQLRAKQEAVVPPPPPAEVPPRGVAAPSPRTRGEGPRAAPAAPPRSKQALPEITAPKRNSTVRREPVRKKPLPLMPIVLAVSFAAVIAGAVALAVTGHFSAGTPAITAQGGVDAAKPGSTTGQTKRRSKELTAAEVAAAARNVVPDPKDETPAAKVPPAMAPVGGKPPAAGIAPEKAPPATVPPAPPVDSLAAAEQAINRNDLDAARVVLAKLLDHPNPDRDRAGKLWVELRMTTDDGWAMQVLTEIDDQKFEMYRKGQMEFDFPGIFPGLISVARQTLRRNLPKAEAQRHAKGEPPAGAPPNPPLPPPAEQPKPPDKEPGNAPDEGAALRAKDPKKGEPAPAGPLPGDPRDLLEAMGLKRSFSTWTLADESRCVELASQAEASDKLFREAETSLRKNTSRIATAKRAAELAASAKKRAEEEDDPPKDSPKRAQLDKRAIDTAAELEAAEAETVELRKQFDDSKEHATATWNEAREISAGLDEKFARLSKDPRVTNALKQMGQQLVQSDEFKAIRGKLSRASKEKPAP